MRRFSLAILLVNTMTLAYGCSDSETTQPNNTPPDTETTDNADTTEIVSHTIAYGAFNSQQPDRAETPWGWAQLIRSAAGTATQVHIEGLTPNANYMAHVHAMPCDIAQGGGHYKFDPTTTDTLESNEIWLALETDANGAANTSTTVAHMARGDAFAVMIHDTPNAESGAGDKYLCANVSLEGTSWTASGQFESFSSAETIDETIAGTVTVSVTPGGTTINMAAEGLDPDATYASHVHALPCDTNAAGAHYKLDPTLEEVQADNELWLTVDVGADGTSSTTLSKTHIARTDAQSVVIHRVIDANTKPKVACAMLIRDSSTYEALTTYGNIATIFEDRSTGTAAATIVRGLDGSTNVTVQVDGFPEGTFNSHVHASSCDLNQGSGHYKIDIDGATDETNELWPTVTVGADGSGSGTAFTTTHIARPEASSVVIHNDDERICIPLIW